MEIINILAPRVFLRWPTFQVSAIASGDVNGDGYADLDLAIGQPRSQRCIVNSTDLGQVQVVFGGASLAAEMDLFEGADVTLHLSGDGSPESVGRVGFKTGQSLLMADHNGDGQGDLLIASPGAFHSNGQNGWVHVVHGGGALQSEYELDQDADLWYVTPEPVGPRLVSGRMGEALAVGDLNADGGPDLIMGAPKGLGENAGFVPMIFGLPDAMKIAMQEVYIAYYGRPADPGGLAYWGMRLYDEDGNLDALIAAYGTSTEYTDRYGALSDGELINTLYQKMFGRDADDLGLQWYIDERLNPYRQEWTDDHDGDPTGATEYALSRIALDILLGAQEDDRLIISHKVEAARYFTRQVVRAGVVYDGDDIPTAMGIMQMLSTDPASLDAAKAEIDAVIGSL